MTNINRRFKLASRPEGLPTKDNWSYVEDEIPEPEDGQVLIRVLYISLDPAMRGWMNAARSYVPPVRVGQVMRAGTIGKILKSRHADFKEGEYVTGMQGVQEYGLSRGEDLVKVDPALAPLPVYLGTLGMPGMTAYFGLLDVGRPKAGDIVVVSGAAGAVGTVVGQIARIKGCKAVGIAGGKDKCDYIIDELGFDAAIDYKNEDIMKGVRKHCKPGVNVYFDNVGGEILDVLLANLARGGCVVVCGAISQYNNTESVRGPSNYLNLLVHRARMEGMVVFDYVDRYPEAMREMSGWMREGKLKSKEHIEEGIKNFPEVFLKLFSGGNFGKLLLKVGDE